MCCCHFKWIINRKLREIVSSLKIIRERSIEEKHEGNENEMEEEKGGTLDIRSRPLYD